MKNQSLKGLAALVAAQQAQPTKENDNPFSIEAGQDRPEFLAICLGGKTIWSGKKTFTTHAVAQDKSGKYKRTKLADLFVNNAAQVRAAILEAEAILKENNLMASGTEGEPDSEASQTSLIMNNLLKGRKLPTE